MKVKILFGERGGVEGGEWGQFWVLVFLVHGTCLVSQSMDRVPGQATAARY